MTVEHYTPTVADPASETAAICRFITDVVETAGADGVVVGLSGGIDSTVSATLAVEALGSENVYGLLLPSSATKKENSIDARHVAEELVIDHRSVEIQPIVDEAVRAMTQERRESKARGRCHHRVTFDPVPSREQYQEAVGNAAARLRMLVTYFEANTRNMLVLGTGNRSELLLGYFTKYGDGGVDLLPIGELYKTQVRELGRHLAVPDRILDKPPTAGLWEGQTDEAELGATYDTIDAILRLLIDEEQSVEQTAETLEMETSFVERFAALYAASEHKRAPPPTPSSWPLADRG